jgi:hypothetical protein
MAGEKLKLSVNDFVLKAAVEALRRVPGVNCSWEGSSIRQHGAVHLAFAVALPDGLITPVIRNAHAKEHPRHWDIGARPFKKLKIKDCTNRPYFGLHPEIVELFLDLTRRVKGSYVHDGLFHPTTPDGLVKLRHSADTVMGFRP